jgi:hypothetical protein
VDLEPKGTHSPWLVLQKGSQRVRKEVLLVVGAFVGQEAHGAHSCGFDLWIFFGESQRASTLALVVVGILRCICWGF